MSWSDSDYYAEEYERDVFIAETLKGISKDGVSGYLGTFGDAIDVRINRSLDQAQELFEFSFFSAAFIAATTAIEMTVRFLLVRPLVQAAFINEDWAFLIAGRIGSGRTDDDRKLLPQLLHLHDIDIAKVTLKNAKALWETITTDIYPKRHRVVHQSDQVSKADASIALECCQVLRNEFVLPIAAAHGFTLDITQCWNKCKTPNGSASYAVSDPFSKA